MMDLGKKSTEMHVLKLILFTMILFSFCFCGLFDEPNCTKKDEITLYCNYFPEDIQQGISKILISMHFATHLVPVVITQANFTASSWSQVIHLEISDAEKSLDGDWSFKNGCFNSLISLNELHIHLRNLNIFEDTLIGLDEVTVLDFSNCARFEKNGLLLALKGTNKLPKLRELLLSYWNSYHGPYDFDDTFVQTLLPRRITHLDISGTHISALNFSAIFKKLKHLEILNVSYANIEGESHKHPVISHNDMKQVRVFDLSYAEPPTQFMSLMPFDYLISNTNLTFSQSGLHFFPFLFAAESVNMSGMVPNFINVILENVLFTVDEDMNWFVKNLILRKNNLKSFDVQFICDNFTFSSIEHFDISDNGLYFIHPTFLYCMINLYEINLAKNQLFRMVNGHRTTFEKLFFGQKRLKYISLSANDLHDVPLYTFSSCRNVQVIDLSNNKLSSVTFLLDGLKYLGILNLQNNNIQILDQTSLNRLNTLWRGSKTTESKANLILRSNPLSCSKCETKMFIKWLTSKILALMIQNLTCISEHGNEEIITENTLNTVQQICNRKTAIISSTVSATGFVSLVITLTLLMYKRHKRLKQIQTRGETIALLRQGEGRYKFMTFLSYSSDDQEFVEQYILEQLNEHLQRVTGLENRQLVCTGDQNFRPGRYVYNEVDRCLDAASVAVMVISDNFCSSEYCCQELDHAFNKRKPVLLMLVGEIDVSMMSQGLKELYYRNTRLLWTLGESGEYVMNTTWENVCESIVDLTIN